MNQIIAIDRTTVRRNITLTGKPEGKHIDALIRNGFQYDEKAQQWWKVEQAAGAPNADVLFSQIDEQELALRQHFAFPEISRDDHQRRYQSYYTPDDIAAELVELAGVQKGMTCLEPSAGDGAIVRAIIEAGVSVGLTAVETDPAAYAALGEHCDARAGDFLSMDSTPGGLGTFDRVVMNPPFSRDQDARHVCHAFSFLKPGGKLVAIVGSYALNGKTDDRRRLQDLIRAHGRLVRDLPPGTFENNARAAIIELVKPAVAQQLAA